MNELTKSKLIDLFQEGLLNWDWESWQSAGAGDKETIVTDAIFELGVDVDIDDAYNLFWEWAEGLDEDSFRFGSLQEDIKKKFKIIYREEEGGPNKSFIVFATSEAEAKQIAWSKVDAEDIWVTELEEACKGLKEALPSAGYRVVLADYDSDDFDINVEFGFQDPDENEVVDHAYLLKPGQTKGDLVVYLSDTCGYTSIFVHDERPATNNDIKRLQNSTFPTMNTGDEYVYYGDIDESVNPVGNKSSSTAILESSLTAEEKVDAWHNGTRKENYKAAGEAKLKAYLEIAKRKGYNEIVDIIEGELAKRGVATTMASASVSSTTPATPAEDPATDTVPELTTSVSDTVEEPVSSAAPVEDTAPAVTLSEKELDALLGMAIQRFGTNVISAYSVWKSAGGFIGSYSLTWRNTNGNPVKSDRAVDKVMDLAYDHNKLIVLVSYFRGGSHNIDRYYSIDVPSSTSYVVDRGTIYKQAREAYSYYDSELNWNFYTLTKNKTNQRKVKIFLLEKVPTLTPEQAEEITTKFFER